jgi:hypothetical protein
MMRPLALAAMPGSAEAVNLNKKAPACIAAQYAGLPVGIIIDQKILQQHMSPTHASCNGCIFHIPQCQHAGALRELSDSACKHTLEKSCALNDKKWY